MKGIINLNKPSGISSAAAVSKVRRVLGTKTVGHMGTLDPMASGVLLLGVGKATRLFDFFLKKDKRYSAIFRFGLQTDTLDSTGTITQTSAIIPTKQQILDVLGEFLGNQQQIPPQYSAKSVGGQRAYKVARQGGELELKPSQIKIFDLKLTNQIDEQSFALDIHCSAGTYIRCIARDIAARLSTYGIMTALVRTSCGSFDISTAVSLEELEQKGAACLTSVEQTLSAMPRLTLDSSYSTPLLNGIKIPVASIKDLFKDTSIEKEPTANKSNSQQSYEGLVTAQSPSKDSIIIANKRALQSENFALYCGNQLFGIAQVDDEGIIKIKTYLKD